MPHNLTPGTALTSKQRKAVDALLATGEVTAAAKEVGISRETLHRWLKQPDFVAAVRDAEARAIDDLSRMLVRLGRSATATLAKAMTDPTVPQRRECARPMSPFPAYCNSGSWPPSRPGSPSLNGRSGWTGHRREWQGVGAGLIRADGNAAGQPRPGRDHRDRG